MRKLQQFMQQPMQGDFRAYVRVCWYPEGACYVAEAIAPDEELDGRGMGATIEAALLDLENEIA